MNSRLRQLIAINACRSEYINNFLGIVRSPNQSLIYQEIQWKSTELVQTLQGANLAPLRCQLYEFMGKFLVLWLFANFNDSAIARCASRERETAQRPPV